MFLACDDVPNYRGWRSHPLVVRLPPASGFHATGATVGPDGRNAGRLGPSRSQEPNWSDQSDPADSEPRGTRNKQKKPEGAGCIVPAVRVRNINNQSWSRALPKP